MNMPPFVCTCSLCRAPKADALRPTSRRARPMYLAATFTRACDVCGFLYLPVIWCVCPSCAPPNPPASRVRLRVALIKPLARDYKQEFDAFLDTPLDELPDADVRWNNNWMCYAPAEDLLDEPYRSPRYVEG